MKNVNWQEIQEYYDNKHSWRDIIKHFKLSNAIISKAVKNKFLKTRTKSDANKLRHIKNPQKLSEETKKKISEGRKQYLQNNPDKVPYLLNHSRNESYPELYFDNIFSKEYKKNEDYKTYLQVGIYEIDFAFLNKGIAIEIDGDQHYLDKKIVESDIRKTEYITKQGWEILRVCWSDYQKLNVKQKEEFIKELFDYINNKVLKPILIKIDNKNYCEDCKKKVERRSKRCCICEGKRRSLELLKTLPSYDIIKNEVKNIGYKGTGRKYNVSDNTIRKWLKLYEKYVLVSVVANGPDS